MDSKFFFCRTCFIYTMQVSWGELHLITHTDTPQSVARLWTRDQPVAPHYRQHSQERDMNAPGGIRTRNPNTRTTSNPRLRPLCQ
jgi:hypothetical protein